MIIRRLQISELRLMTEGGFSFFKEAQLPGEFNPAAFEETWKNLLYGGKGHILASFAGSEITGVLGFVVSRDLHTGDLMATETMWYTLPNHRGHGIRLLKAFEEQAAKLGAKRIAMIHLLTINAPELEKLYQRMGYKAIEVHYLKEVQP